eukprot:6019307-Amphidinium_carterae.1
MTINIESKGTITKQCFLSNLVIEVSAKASFTESLKSMLSNSNATVVAKLEGDKGEAPMIENSRQKKAQMPLVIGFTAQWGGKCGGGLN